MAVPAPEPLTLRYVLHELPPGRLPFRRWRWEVWRGERLEARGWTFSERDAARAVRRHASRVGHQVLGVPALPRETRDFEPFRPGSSVQVRDGSVLVSLVPLHLELAA